MALIPMCDSISSQTRHGGIARRHRSRRGRCTQFTMRSKSLLYLVCPAGGDYMSQEEGELLQLTNNVVPLQASIQLTLNIYMKWSIVGSRCTGIWWFLSAHLRCTLTCFSHHTGLIHVFSMQDWVLCIAWGGQDQESGRFCEERQNVPHPRT